MGKIKLRLKKQKTLADKRNFRKCRDFDPKNTSTYQHPADDPFNSISAVASRGIALDDQISYNWVTDLLRYCGCYTFKHFSIGNPKQMTQEGLNKLLFP